MPFLLLHNRAWDNRRNLLGTQANNMADRDSTGKGSEYYYCQLLQQEEERLVFQRIKYAFKPAKEGVSRVEIENDNGTCNLICDKERIEH